MWKKHACDTKKHLQAKHGTVNEHWEPPSVWTSATPVHYWPVLQLLYRPYQYWPGLIWPIVQTRGTGDQGIAGGRRRHPNSQSGKTPRPSRVGTKHPVWGNPHFDVQDRLVAKHRMITNQKSKLSLNIDILIHNWASENKYAPLDILNINIFYFGSPVNDCI